MAEFQSRSEGNVRAIAVTVNTVPFNDFVRIIKSCQSECAPSIGNETFASICRESESQTVTDSQFFTVDDFPTSIS